MTTQEFVEEIVLQLGGNVVDVELETNQQMEQIVNLSLRELQRYINITKYATLPYAPCIDLSDVGVQMVVNVMRTTQPNGAGYDYPDAFYYALNGAKGGIDSLQDYRTYLSVQRLKNTIKTDLTFRWDENGRKLYISANYPKPSIITIQYIPTITAVEQLESIYWQDQLRQLALAHSKVILGRIRGKYTLNNALYSLDPTSILQEGITELAAIRERLQANNDLVLPID